MEHTHDLCEGCGKPFTKKRKNQKYHNGSCRWKAWSKGRVYINIAELPPHIRQQIADFLASKKPSKQ